MGNTGAKSTVVAVNLITGTEYFHVGDWEPKGKYVFTNAHLVRRSGLKPTIRIHVKILRPDLVMTRRPETRRIVQSHRQVTRQDIDMLIKGHINTKAFLDYDGFLDDLMRVIS